MAISLPHHREHHLHHRQITGRTRKPEKARSSGRARTKWSCIFGMSLIDEKRDVIVSLHAFYEPWIRCLLLLPVKMCPGDDNAQAPHVECTILLHPGRLWLACMTEESFCVLLT